MLTKKQLSEYLNVTERTIDRYRKNGMPFIRLADRLIRFDLDQVKEWLKIKK